MRFLATVITASMAVAVSHAQSTRGTLTGSVVDSAGGALQGAQVTLDPGALTVITDAQGQFTVPALAAGEYTLSVAYTGFSLTTQTASVTGGQTARATVVLKVSGRTEGVEVYAGREGGEVEAINRTFNADEIINVLPADVITSLPNANVADAIGRLAGVVLERDEGEGKYVKVRGTEPRLTHTTLDGVNIASPETVRQIKLDLIPADLVESVQIYKTLQANLEGDGIGGSVDLRTKSAEDKPTIFLEALGGYNPIIQGRSNYQFDGTLGKRFLGGKLGAILSGSYDWNGRGINDVEPGPAITAGTYDLRDYRYFRDRRGFGGTLDYRVSQTGSVYLKGLYSHFNNYGDDWIYSPAINSFVGNSTTQGGTDGSISFQSLRRRPVQDIGGLQFGGHQILGRTLLNYDLESSIGRTRDAGYADANFQPVAKTNPLNNISYQLDLSNPLLPHINPQNGTNIFDPSKYFLVKTTNNFLYNPEVDLGFGASLNIPYTFAGHNSSFEFGGRFRNVHKFENQNNQTITPTLDQTAAGQVEDPSLAMTNFLRTDFSDPNYYGGAYGPYGPTVDTDKVLAFQQQSVTGGVFGNSFDQVEKVSAGYLMNTTTLGKFRVNLGLRIEGTNENNKGYLGAKNANSTGTSAVILPGSYINLLPSASVRYGLTPTSGLRLVYARGLSRPQFSDLVPFQQIGNQGKANQSVTQGNPGIRAEYADNLDLLYERTLPHQGLLQAGFFYKNLQDAIVATQTLINTPNPVQTGNNSPYFLQQTVNAGSGYVYGLELAFQQRFTYLPGLLNGLGTSFNYEYTGSNATLPANQTIASGTSLNRPLIGQATNSYNFSPTYDKRDLSVRLGMTYNGPNIAAYGDGTNGPNGDNYFYSHLQIDLQGSYNLPKGFQFVASALNLNNEVFGFYNGDPQYPVQREFYRQTFSGGLRWSPRRTSR